MSETDLIALHLGSVNKLVNVHDEDGTNYRDCARVN